MTTIEINGVEVELNWGEGQGLGTATHTVPVVDVGNIGPCDGEKFSLNGKQYRLGQYDYSTDQPGCENDAECTCSAAIYEVE